MESVTADDLKKHLLKSFEKKGVLENLRAKLRSELVLQLGKDHIIEDDLCQSKDPKENIPSMVSNWLIVDYLRRNGYDLTISTYMAELKSKSKHALLDSRLAFNALNKRDIYQVLNLMPNEICGNTEILTELVNLHSKPRPKYGDGVDESITAAMNDMNTQTDVQFKIEKELSQNSELFKNEMEHKFYEKFQKLQEREKLLIAEHENQRKILEDESINQKQMVIDEIDEIRKRNNESQRRLKERFQELSLLEEKIQEKFHQLQIKQKQCYDRDRNLDQIINEACDKYKKQVESEIDSRVKIVEKKEEDVQLKLNRLLEQEEEIKESKLKSDQLSRTNFELSLKLEHSEKEISKQSIQISEFEKRLKETWDYDRLKLQCSTLNQEISDLRIQLTSLTKERDRQENYIKELQIKISEPSPFVSSLQKTISELSDKKIKDEKLLKDEIEELKSQLKANEMKVINTKEMLEKEILNSNTLSSQLMQTKQALNQSHMNFRNQLSSKANFHKFNADLDIRSSEKPLIDEDFINNTKKRLRALETEAENITRNYSVGNNAVSSSPNKSLENPLAKQFVDPKLIKNLKILDSNAKVRSSYDHLELPRTETIPQREVLSKPHVKRSLFSGNKQNPLDIGASKALKVIESDNSAVYNKLLPTSTPINQDKLSRQLVLEEEIKMKHSPIACIPLKIDANTSKPEETAIEIIEAGVNSNLNQDKFLKSAPLSPNKRSIIACVPLENDAITPKPEETATEIVEDAMNLNSNLNQGEPIKSSSSLSPNRSSVKSEELENSLSQKNISKTETLSSINISIGNDSSLNENDFSF